MQFSLLSKGPEQLETLAICRDLGITVIAYSPLGLGEHCLPDTVRRLCSCTGLWRQTHDRSSSFQARTVTTTTSGRYSMVERRRGCCAAGMLTGKYSADSLPQGPRGLLFRQILPGIEPLTDVMQQVAASRRKTPSQVRVSGQLGGGAAVDACLLVPNVVGAHTACWEVVALPGAGQECRVLWR